MRLASGVAQIVSTGEQPGVTEQRPLTFDAWVPGPAGTMLQIAGYANTPVLRDTLVAVVRSLTIGVQ